MVSADAAIARFAGRIAAMPAQPRCAMVKGLNEGGDLERTKVRRDLREQMGVTKAGTVTKHTGSKRATAGDLTYEIRGTGKGLPIREFPVRSARGAPVTARPWAVTHKFARSFTTSAKGLLRARRGAARMPIRALRGPSPAKEIVKDQTAAGFMATASPLVMGAVVKRLGRMLP